MKRILFTLVIFLSSSVASSAITPTKMTREDSVSGNRKRSYYQYVPENVNSKNGAPLILLLHGSNSDGASLIEKWKDLADKEGVVLVGPNSRDSSRWVSPDDGPDFLRDVPGAVRWKYEIV